ncbi:protein containing prepilin-type N- cleavage/methylation domain protein, partial [Sulfurimonas sp.]
MKKHAAFTMIELIFVIIIMGIIGKFGVEFLAQAYESFIFSKTNNELQSSSEIAVETIASRLQYRIKDSVIARKTTVSTPVAIADATGSTYKVLEWIGSDEDGFRGSSDNNVTPYLPNWSGILDLNAGNKDTLVSPQTDTAEVNGMISDLSSTTHGVKDAALYFVGGNTNIQTGYGWNGALTNQQGAMHPIKAVVGHPNEFTSSNGVDFSGIDVYEYYKLAWTAYAIVYEAGTNGKGLLRLYYDFQPWNGGTIANAKSTVLMENVST